MFVGVACAWGEMRRELGGLSPKLNQANRQEPPHRFGVEVAGCQELADAVYGKIQEL